MTSPTDLMVELHSDHGRALSYARLVSQHEMKASNTTEPTAKNSLTS